MGLVPIDRTRWPRRARYEWVQKTGQGPFAVTVPLDVTLLAGEPLYPALLWLLTQGVNEMEAFRGNAGGFGDLRSYGPGLHGVSPPREDLFGALDALSSGLPGLPGSLSARCGGLWGFPGMDAPGRPSGEYLRCLHGALDVFFGVSLGGHHRAPLSAPHFYAGKMGFPRGGAGPAPYGSNPSGGVRSLPRSSAADAAPEGHCGVSPPVRKPWTFPAGLYIIRVPLYERRDCFLWQTQL